jgi:ABC-type antimicrobial peptide transport system permease subunit
MENLLENSTDLKIVGIIRPSQDASTTVLSMGVNYTPELITYLMEEAARTRIVREQLAFPEVNVLSGRTFEDERENPESHFDFSRIISVDEELFRNTLDFEDALSGFDLNDMDFGDLDFSSLDMRGFNFGNLDFGNIDMSGLDLSGMDFSDIDLSGVDFSNLDLGDLTFDMSGVPFPQLDMDMLLVALAGQVSIPPEVLSGVINSMMENFLTVYVPSLPTPPLTPQDWMNSLNTFLGLDSTSALIMNSLGQALASTDLADQIGTALQSVLEATMMAYMAQVMDVVQLQMQVAMMNAIQNAMQLAMASVMQSVSMQIETAMQDAMQGLSSQIGRAMQGSMSALSRQMESAMSEVTDQIAESIQSAFEEISEEMQSAMDGFDGEALADAFQLEIGEDEIFDLMMSIMSPSVSSYDQTLHMLGYADPNVPAQILIYPRSFEAKESILEILSQYNSRMEENGEPEKVVRFIDMVGLIMSSVTDIIDMVSYALVTFVSVALVVSSIMIGVITFISVLERKKEIGILRAVGASKGNIRLVFNAETLIIGFVAGVIGVLVTFVIVNIANIILNNLLGIEQLVIMPGGVSIVLVVISMFLTYVAGLIPASAAARKAPVEALRSE